MTAAPAMIGAFHILRELGRGGMGEVYLARDTRLDRQVAIKALPEAFAADPDRLARFQREAKVLASLNHPGIGSIHGLEEVGGHKYLVLEYIEGETLADRLKRGAIPIDEALPLAKQIAEALEAAHEKGVIHRDLKPGNVMVTEEGKVKVLDFGLARTTDGAPSSTTADAMTRSPTMTSPAPVHSPTIPGAIMGSAGYMSPEQARGKAVDRRSDIFSFGCVLYEMLTGEQPFGGETITDSLGAILHREPEWPLLPAATPQVVRHLLKRCLAKDKHQRLRDIGDARLDLEAAMQPDSALDIPAAITAARQTSRWPWALVALLAAAGAFALGQRLTPAPTPAPPVFAEMTPPPDTRLVAFGDFGGPVAVSPDGAMVLFAARSNGENQRLWLRRLDKAEPEPLQGTDGGTFPFWSPDSRSIGFFVAGKLRALDLATRALRTVCEAVGGRGGAWTSGGLILFSPGFQTPIFKVSASGGSPEPLTQIDPTKHTSHRWPFAFPDGRHFLFTAVSHGMAHREESTLYLASLDGTPPLPVLRSEYSAEVAGGRLLFVREGRLMAVRINELTGELSGEPVALIPSIATDLSTWRSGFSVSPSGVLAYQTPDPHAQSSAGLPLGTPATGVANRIAEIRRDGHPIARWFDGILNNGVSLSPDGSMLATSAIQKGASSTNIWIQPLATMEDGTTPIASGKDFPLTFGKGDNSSPVWSPDGKTLAYANRSQWAGDETHGILIKQVGGGTERLVVPQKPEGPDVWPVDWSRDGRFLVFVKGSWIPKGIDDLWALPLEGGDPFPIVSGPGDEDEAAISPDGRWIAYVSNAAVGTENQVYVQAFPPGWIGSKSADAAGAPDSRWRISIAGGRRPRWRADAKELYFLNPSGSLIAVRVTADQELLRFDTGTALFQISGDPFASDFDVTADGQTFYVQETDTPADMPISIVLNWQRLLEPRKP